MEKGKLNRITDVEGVLVGHKTISSGTHQTGVTFIRTAEDVFHQKLACGCSILNGFGKTTGLPQIMELGTLESYICLTNTLNVGVVQQALVDIMVKENEDLTSVNVVVGECNDGYLNAIRDCVVTKEDDMMRIVIVKKNLNLAVLVQVEACLVLKCQVVLDRVQESLKLMGIHIL